MKDVNLSLVAVICAIFLGLALMSYSCAKSGSKAESHATKSIAFEVNKLGVSSNESSEQHKGARFHYDGYSPSLDGAFLVESQENPIRLNAARTYSSAAWLCKSYFGFFPETIEQMWKLGLVPYEISGDDYTFVKQSLSYKFWARPIRRGSDGQDMLIRKQPVSIEDASPDLIMEYKYGVLTRTLKRVDGLGPHFSGFEVFAPGLDDRSEQQLGKTWTLNKMFRGADETGFERFQFSRRLHLHGFG